MTATSERKRTGRPATLEDASMITLRLEKKLQKAFSEVVAARGTTQSEAIRNFMLQTVQAAGRGDLLNN